MSLSSFATCVNKNCGWLALFFLFERIMFLQLDDNGFRDGNRSNKGIDSGESKMKSSVKEKYIYRKDKKLL